jgi:hypothetical protein
LAMARRCAIGLAASTMAAELKTWAEFVMRIA